MNQISNIKDDYLISICKTAALSSVELLDQCEIDSYEWALHISGLAFGIWISLCDPIYITLDEIDELINEIVISSLN